MATALQKRGDGGSEGAGRVPEGRERMGTAKAYIYQVALARCDGSGFSPAIVEPPATSPCDLS